MKPIRRILRKNAPTLVGGAISIFCLWWVFRGIHLGTLWTALKQVNPLWLVVSTGLFMFAMYLRALRWGRLFRPNYSIDGNALFRPMMVGFAYNSIMPGRVGEFARSFIVGKRQGTGFPTAFATVFSERVFDAVTLLSLLSVCLSLMPPIDPDMAVEVWGAKVRGSLINSGLRNLTIFSGAMVLGVIFLLIPGVERLLVKLVEGAPLLPGGLRGFAVGAIGGVIRGFQAMRDPLNLLAIVGYSIVVWSITALSTLVLAWGMPGMQDMNYLQAVSLMVLVGIFIAVPASPGYWGPFEAGCVFSIVVLGVDGDQTKALAYAIVLHLTQYIPVVIPGLVFARGMGVQVSKAREESDEAPATGGAG